MAIERKWEIYKGWRETGDGRVCIWKWKMGVGREQDREQEWNIGKKKNTKEDGDGKSGMELL